MLKLSFSAGPSFELLKTEFSHPEINDFKLSIRGKDKGAYLLAGTFQWTQAVHALSLFFLKAILSKEQTILAGEIGSPAASLDFALAKPPLWLIEMFGLSKNSKPFIKKLIKRSNPELKRQGPVELSLNSNLFAKNEIEIYVSKQKINLEQEINEIIKYLEDSWKTSGKILFKKNINQTIEKNNLLSKETKDDFSLKLKEIYIREISSMLCFTDIFSPSGQKKIQQRVLRNLSIPGYGFKQMNFSHANENNLSSSERLGAISYDLRESFQNLPKLRIALPLGFAPSIALFKYISLYRNYPIEIDYNFNYAIEIMRRVIKSEFIRMPDLIGLGLAPAASYLNQKNREYSPIMLMPAMSHRVLKSAKNKAEDSRPSEFFMLYEEFSTSQIYHELLKLSGELPAKSKVTHIEPNQIFEVLQNADAQTRAISFFPHYDLNTLYQTCAYGDRLENDFNLLETVLFIHNSHLENKQLISTLSILIRDAWLNLREMGDEFKVIINDILADKEYLRLLKRFSGLTSTVA